MNTLNQKRGLIFSIIRSKYLLLMALPGLIFLLINNYLPMVGVLVAFKDINYSKGLFGSDWVGFKNFKFLFRTQDAFLITRNTLLYNAVFIVSVLVFSVFIAILLNEVKKRYLVKLFQSAILLPFFISMVVVGYLVYSFLSIDNGIINNIILKPLGMNEIAWYSRPELWPYILVIVNLWKYTGYNCLIYFAAIVGIDQEYYEAAVIDGANKWQQIKNITLPLLLPVISTLTLLQVGRIFYSDFGMFYQVTLNTGALLPTTNVIDTYVYRSLLVLGDIGMASAACLYQSFVGFILVFAANYIVKKIDKENALF